MKTRIKVHKTNEDHHGYIEGIEKLDFGNLPAEERRTEENLHGFAYRNLSKALRKHLGLDFLHGNKFFLPKTAEMHSQGNQ